MTVGGRETSSGEGDPSESSAYTLEDAPSVPSEVAGSAPRTSDIAVMGPDIGEPSPASSGRSITDLELEFAQRPESDVYVELVQAYIAKRRFMEAMVVCKKVVRTFPDQVQPKLILAGVHEAQGRLAKSIEVLSELQKEHPNDTKVQLAWGRTLVAKGEEAEGIALLRTVVESDPSQIEVVERFVTTGTLTDAVLAQVLGGLRPSSVESQVSLTTAPVPTPEAMLTSDDVSSSESAQPSDCIPPQLSLEDSLDSSLVPDADNEPQGQLREGLLSDAAPSQDIRLPAGKELPPSQEEVFVGPIPGKVVLEEPSPPLPPVPSGTYRIAPQRLEGEDELERLAEEMANERPPRGKLRHTLVLLAALTVCAVGILVYRVTTAARAQAIHQVAVEVRKLTNDDLYVGYKKAAEALESVLSNYDSQHGPSLAKLAHIYGILLSEHLETDAQSRLKEILPLAMQFAPNEPDTRAARALLLMATSDGSKGARDAMDELLPYAVTNQAAALSVVDLTIGIAELEVGELQSAHQRLRKVANFFRNRVRERIWSARAAAKVGRWAMAQRIFMEATKLEPKHPGAVSGIALMALARGDLAASSQALEKFEALELAGSRDISPRDRARATFAKSELLRRAGREAGADVEYEQAIRLDPGNPNFPFERALGLLERDQVEEAITYLKKAVTMEPERWTFRVQMAEAFMLTENYELAEEHLNAALAKAPQAFPVALAKARYLRRKQSPEVEAYLLETLRQKFPEAKVEIALELGRYYRDQRNLSEAEKQLTEAMKLFGNRSPALQAQVLVAFGQVLSGAQRNEEAASAYRAAAQQGSLDALALLANLLQDGDRSARREALSAAEKYLAAGKNLRSTEMVEAIVNRLR
ncbi:MAG: tetratricopeptide repeat protein [Myxococcales bacterium]|nr:tetratricopeptide repeat protein [Myxococcales bacterium]